MNSEFWLKSHSAEFFIWYFQSDQQLKGKYKSIQCQSCVTITKTTQALLYRPKETIMYPVKYVELKPSIGAEIANENNEMSER